MSTPGWYPDPGGRPGHYRLWDGRSWGSSTRADPPGGPASDPPPSPRRRAPWVLGGAVLLAVLAVVAVLVLRTGQLGAGTAPVPSASAPVGRDGPSSAAPVPSSQPSQSAGPALPSTTAPTPAPTDPCPVGNPLARQDHPRDGRVHGGSLSFPRQPGWQEPGQQADAFTWAYDVGETDVQVEPQWLASYAVGAVSVADGFEDPRSAAELAMRCTVASSLYRDVTSRTDTIDASTTVDGYRAWTLRTEVRVQGGQTTFEGDTVQVTVVDLGSPEALAFFWGSAPIGDAALTQQLGAVADQLRVG